MVTTFKREHRAWGCTYLSERATLLSWYPESPAKGVSAAFPKTTKEDLDVCKPINLSSAILERGRSPQILLFSQYWHPLLNGVVFLLSSSKNSFCGELIFSPLLFFFLDFYNIIL